MLVIFRTRADDWKRHVRVLMDHEQEIKGFGCTRLEAFRNRKHPEEWVMIQEWPDKETFDKYARERGPALDKEAGVRWTDVSTWSESAF